MGVVRIQAIGPRSVEYLLHGCDPKEPSELGAGPAPGQELEADGAEVTPTCAGVARPEPGVGYFLDQRGEPAGRWLGSGMDGLGLTYRPGDVAHENDVRAIFGELRYPTSQVPGSTHDGPTYLGAKPRKYQTLAERVEAALKAEPDASAERQREIEVQTARNSKSNTAYYDVTFSPVKSVSVYYAALIAAGDAELAVQVRQAHDQAVRIAVESAEEHVAWAKIGRHGRASESGRTTGEWRKATGLSAVLFAHHTNRDGEPQLHAHVAVLNRVSVGDGRVFALDGAAFRPVKDAMAAAYDRAMEALLSERAGVVWVERADGTGREIAGIDPAMLEEASSRTRAHVEPRVEELVVAYQQRHGHDPGPQARHKIVDQAVKDTRRPKTGPAGPAAVSAWIGQDDGRAERLTAALDEVDRAVTVAAANGHPAPTPTGYGPVPDTAAGPRITADGRAPMAGDRGAATGRGSSLADRSAAMADGRSRTVGGQHPEMGATERHDAPAGEWVTATDRAAMGERAVAAGLASVQARYATWSIGALYREIDHRLGSAAGAAGLGIDERRAWVWELTRATVAPAPDSVVVQVSMGDPVPVPEELRREADGRSKFRAPIDERYVTADHLGVEERLVATAQTPTARTLPAETVECVANDARRAGLSSDQIAAVTAVLASPQQVEVLVGPAGAGKSHTLALLARAWTAEHGGRVIGTSTGEKATRNLAELGMNAVNTTRLLRALEPDARGRVRMVLQPDDLLIVDEAGMASTTELDAITRHAAAAGAKVIWAGDHHQLPAITAGGLFAYLAERAGAIELEQVHRFSHQWERDASLRLRIGDVSVAPTYANEGRLRAGTLEQMEYLATRDYLADRLDGASALLIVGSNERAAQLSRDIQEQLTKLGHVSGHDLIALRDHTGVRMGDLIQTRDGNASIRVDAGVDEHGRPRPPMPVANRQVFTVVGHDPAAGTLFARDEHGAVAHLPIDYVESQVTLAYAVTNHAAQGVTVDRARALAERGMSAEALYPAATRGRHLNMIYLQTEVDPDPHAPQRERDTAVAALVRTLDNDAGELTDAALSVREAAELEVRSMLTLAEHYERVAASQGHTRHGALAVDQLGAAVRTEDAFGALLGRMRAVELEGHDIGAIFAEAKAMGTLRSAQELSKVMHWRLGVLQTRRTPERSREEVLHGDRVVRPAWAQLAEQHRDRAVETGDAAEDYLATAAQRAHRRTEELGREAAAARPAWAIEWLGPLPDAADEPEAHQTWVRGAGQVAAYREWRGIPDSELSIGAAPPPAQQLAYELWTRAADTGAGDPRVADWRKASDVELREAVERWRREQQWGPAQVGADRGEALALAHDASNDAAIGRAHLDAMEPGDPGRDRLRVRVHADELMADQALRFAASLDEAHVARGLWWEETRDVREAARAAASEIAHRGLSRHDEPDPGNATADPSERGDAMGRAPQAAPTGPEDLTPEPTQRPARDTGAASARRGTALDAGQDRERVPERAPGAAGEDTAAELHRTMRDLRATRITRDVKHAAHQVEPAPERGPAKNQGTTAKFERDAILDDELAAHREPRQRQIELELRRERDRDRGPDPD